MPIVSISNLLQKSFKIRMKTEKTYSAEVEIKNSLGLHARPASLFVQLASSFISEIKVEKDGESVNGKSLMGLLLLAAGYGTQIKITAIGNDAEKALQAIIELINSKFQEE
jgi:phosphocarrier protein